MDNQHLLTCMSKETGYKKMFLKLCLDITPKESCSLSSKEEAYSLYYNSEEDSEEEYAALVRFEELICQEIEKANTKETLLKLVNYIQQIEGDEFVASDKTVELLIKKLATYY